MEMMRKTLRPPLKRTVESAPERKPQGAKPKSGPNSHTNACFYPYGDAYTHPYPVYAARPATPPCYRQPGRPPC